MRAYPRLSIASFAPWASDFDRGRHLPRLYSCVLISRVRAQRKRAAVLRGANPGPPRAKARGEARAKGVAQVSSKRLYTHLARLEKVKEKHRTFHPYASRACTLRESMGRAARMQHARYRDIDRGHLGPSDRRPARSGPSPRPYRLPASSTPPLGLRPPEGGAGKEYREGSGEGRSLVRRPRTVKEGETKNPPTTQ